MTSFGGAQIRRLWLAEAAGYIRGREEERKECAKIAFEAAMSSRQVYGPKEIAMLIERRIKERG